MPSKKRVLLVENDIEQAALIRSEFERFPDFCTFAWLQTPEDALSRLHEPVTSWPHLLLIDATLQQPGDGITWLRRIKRDGHRHTIPIIMLSARGEEYDKLFGFELGIDDYVTKPFSPKELMARVNAVIARHAAQSPRAQGENIIETLDFQGLSIDMAGRNVTVDGEKVELTPKEYELLFYLVENKNIALSREKLLSDIWGYDSFGVARTVDVHIRRIRAKIEVHGHAFIETVRNVGYRLVAEARRESVDE